MRIRVRVVAQTPCLYLRVSRPVRLVKHRELRRVAAEATTISMSTSTKGAMRTFQWAVVAAQHLTASAWRMHLPCLVWRLRSRSVPQNPKSSRNQRRWKSTLLLGLHRSPDLPKRSKARHLSLPPSTPVGFVRMALPASAPRWPPRRMETDTETTLRIIDWPRFRICRSSPHRHQTGMSGQT